MFTSDLNLQVSSGVSSTVGWNTKHVRNSNGRGLFCFPMVFCFPMLGIPVLGQLPSLCLSVDENFFFFKNQESFLGNGGISCHSIFKMALIKFLNI